VDTGRGIAEFTHRNFVSARTNFFRTDAGGFIAHPDFPLPAPGPVTEKREISDSDLLGSNQPLRGEIWFIGTVVTDTLTGQTSFNPRASSYSVFAADLRGRSGLRTVTLNQFNFRSAYEYLIPRAVAYSAGMINYFFRGKMDVENDETDPAKIRIVNLGPETMNGRFRLFYDAKDGNRYPVAVDPTDPNRDYSDPNAWFLTIAGLDQAGEYSTRSDALAFIPPANDGSPASPKTVNQYMLVFSGNMGEERVGPGMIGAVAAKRVVQKFARVFAGAEHSMVVKRNGTLLVFGENRNGQLGQGYFSEWPDIGIPTAVAVPGVDKVVEAAGGWYSLVRREDGSLLVWGNNDRGELGIGPTPRYVASPLPLTLPGSGKPSAVAGGWIATYVLKDDGSLWSWGYNGQGQLGDGTYSSRSTPMQVTSNVAALARSSVGDHMLVLRRDGSVWAWGENEAGQLGDGSLVTTSPWGKALPVRVALPGGVVALAAGGDHSLALLSNGTVWAWGYNQGGNLGVGHTGTYQLTPAPVLGLSDVVAIAAGYDFSLALRRDGTVWAWGRNDVCQLGNGRGGLAFEGPYPPTQVQGPSGVTDIAAGEYHALALQADGKLWSWGYNDRGQTGDGTMTASDPWCRPDPRIVLDAN
jgi:alpha-tubulin suppressor-like RCC1 family protein